MNTLSERLIYAMSKAGISQAQLASAVNMAQPSIWKLTSGKTNATRKLFEISRVLGVNPQWLASGEGPEIIDNSAHHPDSSIPPESEWKTVKSWDSSTPIDDDEVEVPFLKDIEFACGTGRVLDEDYNGYKLRFSKATLRKVGANTDGSGILCFPARGDSMEPAIPDGTTVAVNTDDKRLVDGKIYAINEQGWKRIKLLHRIGPDRVSVRSFNRDEYPDEDHPISDIEIIGRVFWYSVLL